MGLLCAHFPMLWNSSIRAVQAESNFDYFKTVQALEQLEDERRNSLLNRGWSAFSSIFLGTSASAVKNTAPFTIQNYLASLGSTSQLCPTLLYELHLHLAGKRIEDFPRSDDSPTSGDEMECQCCFGDVVPADATACAAGCLFCRTCLSRAVQETVFGQAPLQLYRPKPVVNVEVAEDPGSGMGIRCLSIEGCQAAFSDIELRRSLPEHVYQALQQRVAAESLQLSFAGKDVSEPLQGETLRKCPFCPYAEIEKKVTLTMDGLLAILNWDILAWIIVVHLWVCWVVACLYTHIVYAQEDPPRSRRHYNGIDVRSIDIDSPSRQIRRRMDGTLQAQLDRKRKRSPIFRCRNGKAAVQATMHRVNFSSPTLIEALMPPAPVTGTGEGRAIPDSIYCGRPSCTLCDRLYYPGHQCSDSREGLRLAIENAATNAVKRQCPECGLGYTKRDGCNKMVCRCGECG